MRGLSLFAVLAFAKIAGAVAHDIDWSLGVVAALLWQDALIALVFEGLSSLMRPRLAWTLYAAVCAYTVANLPVVRVLATPMTVPMLRATDGALADSILRYATASNALLLLAGGVLAWFAPRLLRRRRLARPAAVALGLVAALGFLATAEAQTFGLHRSALTTLARSAFPRLDAVALPDEDWRMPYETAAPGQDCTGLQGRAQGRNVVLVVLESAAAIYLKPWGGEHDPMPNLTRLAQRSLVFENAYAVYPESVKGLVALLASRPPAMDTDAEDYAGARFASLPDVLSDAGYRTALFHSGRFDYLGMEAVIRDRGYDVLHDAGDITGVHESSFGVDEASTVDHVLRWTGRQPTSTPWFVTYMPIAGHHPYDAPEPGPFDARTERGAYYNALHYADRHIGRLLDGVPADTLVVVVGDHGQAFRQHPGNYGHSFFLYEENVRVPLLISVGAPAARIARVASHLDVAPTVLHLLGLEAPGAFRGHSLLDPARRTAMMFTDYSMALLALRDGTWKFIYEVESGRSALFDLEVDPTERSNLAGRHPARVRSYRDRLLRWGTAQRAVRSAR